MKVTIIIPTVSSERIPILLQTIESIIHGSYREFHIVVVADGNPYISEVFNKGKYGDYGITLILNEKRIGWIASTNRMLKKLKSEYYIYASDDLIFPPDCIENAMQRMEECFPDGYGVVTISKKNRCPFGLIGNKFVEHFPDRQVFCPDYFHYGSDTELRRFVMSSNLFAYPPERESQVLHQRLGGETRRLSRQSRDRDHEVRDERKEAGYLWGKNFNLIRR